MLHIAIPAYKGSWHPGPFLLNYNYKIYHDMVISVIQFQTNSQDDVRV